MDGGVIKTAPDTPQAERIRTVAEALSQVARAHRPNVACLERVFANINAKTTLALGEARGAALAALALAGIEVVEMSALQVKRTIAGAGRADKRQVAEMVARMLACPEARKLSHDETDALACALAAASPLARMHSRLPAVRVRKGGKSRSVRAVVAGKIGTGQIIATGTVKNVGTVGTSIGTTVVPVGTGVGLVGRKRGKFGETDRAIGSGIKVKARRTPSGMGGGGWEWGGWE